MRRLLSFMCEGAALGATLDAASGKTGVIIVTGGTQTRIGSHRMFERLAAALAAEGYSCFRFDRRGVGDSEGADPDFRGNAPDLEAAVAAFRSECPTLDRIVGFGLCDGATSLALFGKAAGIDAIILANPWLVETEAGAPPAAAIKQHYRDRLMSVEGWKKLLSGSMSYSKVWSGLMKIAAPAAEGLGGEVAASLKERPLPVTMLLARKDNTAIAAADVWQSLPFRAVRERQKEPLVIDSDSHTFARPGDDDLLLSAVLDALRG